MLEGLVRGHGLRGFQRLFPAFLFLWSFTCCYGEVGPEGAPSAEFSQTAASPHLTLVFPSCFAFFVLLYHFSYAEEHPLQFRDLVFPDVCLLWDSLERGATGVCLEASGLIVLSEEAPDEQIWRYFKAKETISWGQLQRSKWLFNWPSTIDLKTVYCIENVEYQMGLFLKPCC